MKRLAIFLSGLSLTLSANASPIEEAQEVFGFELQPPHSAKTSKSGLLKIKKAAIGRSEFTVLAKCKRDSLCRSSVSLGARGRFEKDSSGIRFVSSSVAANGDPVYAHFKIEDEDFLYYFLTPDHAISTGEELARQCKVVDRFVSNFQVVDEGVWFYDNIDCVNPATGSPIGVIQVAFAIQGRVDHMAPRYGHKNYAFFHLGKFNDETELVSGLDYGHPDYDPTQRIIHRIPSNRKITWAISDPGFTAEEKAFFEESVKEWLKYLPQGIEFQFKHYDAFPEDLNPFYFQIAIKRAAANASWGFAHGTDDGLTGAVVSAYVSIAVPGFNDSLKTKQSSTLATAFNENKSTFRYGGFGNNAELCDMNREAAAGFVMSDNGETKTVEDNKRIISGVLQHEVGHILGLRHNFRGSLWDSDPVNFPGGSSVMEYTYDARDYRIGPYDQAALRYGYLGQITPETYPLCGDMMAGDFQHFGSPDPLCNRWDPTFSDPFTHIYDKSNIAIDELLSNRIPNLKELKMNKTLFSYPFRSYLPKSNYYYSQLKFDKTLALIDRLRAIALDQQGESPKVAKFRHQLFIIGVSELISTVFQGQSMNEVERQFAPVQDLLSELSRTNSSKHGNLSYKLNAFAVIAADASYRSYLSQEEIGKKIMKTIVADLNSAIEEMPEIAEENRAILSVIEARFNQTPERRVH
ncbi:MAG: zinc-dependent metalloprotease [Proteobacteria bacterium]|nr:zinc-dependent metalloprotease [Pseudomonadota bacterium]